MSRRAQMILRNAAFLGPAGSAGTNGINGTNGVGLLYAALADSAVVSNSTALTPVLTNVAQVAANPPVGKVLRVKVAGYVTTAGGVAGNLAIGLCLDGTATAVDAFNLAVGAGSAARFSYEFIIVVRDNSAAGQWQAAGIGFGESNFSQMQADNGPTAVNGTVAHFLNPTLQWSVANANNQAWIRSFTLEQLS